MNYKLIGERAPDLDGIRQEAELHYDPEHIDAELFLVPATDFARNEYKNKMFATFRNIVSPKQNPFFPCGKIKRFSFLHTEPCLRARGEPYLPTHKNE